MAIDCYKGITPKFVKKLGKEILDSKIDKNDVLFIEKPLDEFLVKWVKG